MFQVILCTFCLVRWVERTRVASPWGQMASSGVRACPACVASGDAFWAEMRGAQWRQEAYQSRGLPVDWRDHLERVIEAPVQEGWKEFTP